jgi:hypothetical protein
LENFSYSEDIDKALENIKENIKSSDKMSLGMCELTIFYEELLRFLDQMKPAKMQWFQDPNQSNLYTLNNVRRKASRHLKGQKG